jgi:predicted PurR-regulated permease PerM
VFSTHGTVTAIAFAAWCVFVMLIDNVLKPMLLGRGVDVPMIVVVIGAIGGLLSMGVIGLFVGAIVLVLGYSALAAWLDNERAASVTLGQQVGVRVGETERRIDDLIAHDPP